LKLFKLDNKGMILSGMAILLLLPAMFLSASFYNIAETGAEEVRMKQFSARAEHTAFNIKKTIRDRRKSRERIDVRVLEGIARDFERETAFNNIRVEWEPFDIRARYSFEGDYTYSHWITTEDWQCYYANLKPGVWFYTFESMQNKEDFSYGEPALRIEKKENNWEITVLERFLHGTASADIFWGEDQILWNVNSDENSPVHQTYVYAEEPADEGRMVGDTIKVENVDIVPKMRIVLEDPAGIIAYEETFPITLEQ